MQQGHRDACLCSPCDTLLGVLPQSDTKAHLWVKKATEAGLAKVMYTVGYVYEVGISMQVSISECIHSRSM